MKHGPKIPSTSLDTEVNHHWCDQSSTCQGDQGTALRVRKWADLTTEKMAHFTVIHGDNDHDLWEIGGVPLNLQSETR